MPSRRELRDTYEPEELAAGLKNYSAALVREIIIAGTVFVLVGAALALWWSLVSVFIVLAVLVVLGAFHLRFTNRARTPVRTVVDPVKNRSDRWATIPWVGFAVSIVLVSMISDPLDAGGAGFWAIIPAAFLLLTLVPDAMLARTFKAMAADVRSGR